MKVRFLLAFSILIPALFAFDLAEWTDRNADMGREADRMKAEYAVYKDRATNLARGVTIPIETFKSGRVKAVVIAESGQFFRENGYVWAEGITVEQYKEDGSLDFRLKASNCLADRPHKCCWIAGRVRAQHRKTTLEGIDAFYCSSNGFLKVMSQARIVSEDVKMKGFKL